MQGFDGGELVVVQLGAGWCGVVQGGAVWWVVVWFVVLGVWFCAGWCRVVVFIIKQGLARGLPRAGFGCGFDFAFMKKFLAVRSTQLTEPP